MRRRVHVQSKHSLNCLPWNFPCSKQVALQCSAPAVLCVPEPSLDHSSAEAVLSEITLSSICTGYRSSGRKKSSGRRRGSGSTAGLRIVSPRLEQALGHPSRSAGHCLESKGMTGFTCDLGIALQLCAVHATVAAVVLHMWEKTLPSL